MTDRQFAASLAAACALIEAALCIAIIKLTSLSLSMSIAVALGLLALLWRAVYLLWGRGTIRALRRHDRHRTEPFARDTVVVDDPDAEVMRDPAHRRIADTLRVLPGEAPPSNWQADVLKRVDRGNVRRRR